MGNIWKWAFLSAFLFFTGCGGNNSPTIPPIILSPPNDLGGCMSANALLLAGGTPLRIVDAADFDGTNDYMLRGADLTGIADGKSGILSVWLRIDGGNGTTRVLLSNLNSTFVAYLLSDNKIWIAGQDDFHNTVMAFHTTNTYAAGATWLNILASWNLSTGVLQLYINDVADLTTLVNTDVTIDYAEATTPNWAVGAYTVGTSKLNGCPAELYFAPNQYLDFSDVNNRRKFISAGGKPVHLGIDGSLPTGTAPIMYLHLDDGEAVANFATNRGTGGNFTITGTLDTATTSPSD